MNYILGIVFAGIGIVILAQNKRLSDKLGTFYARRYSAAFGKLAHFFRLDDPNTSFNRFMYRGFVITAGIIFILFSMGAFLGTNFVGPSDPGSNSLLQAN